jgi:uncharacterized membrane protein YedE/YeeE
MKNIRYILIGILFGIVMSKSEAISWYRIYEMFLFKSLHMYKIIGVAVFLGVIGVGLIKKFNLKDFSGKTIKFRNKEKKYIRYIFGGIIFGMGWALTGACPGPIVVNIGYGYLSMIIVFVFAVVGTYLYGVFKDNLPH